MLTIENINLIQRTAAIIALGLLSLQIYTKSSKKIFTYFMYLFIFVQPILVVLSRYIFNSDLDPFYMYTDLCVLCDGRGEFIINFLRISFYTVSIAVFIPVFKDWNKFIKSYYNEVSTVAYYAGFYTLAIYLYLSGPLVKSELFNLYFWSCQLLVLFKIFKEIKFVFKPKSKV